MNDGQGPYTDLTVIKLECINHVQKRMVPRLTKVRDEAKVEVVTQTGKRRKVSTMGGKNKLSDANIAILASIFGLAIRHCIGMPRIEMIKAIMATFHHIFSTKEHPRHGLCPEGPDSWCYFQKALAKGEQKQNIKFKRSSTVINLDEEGQKKVKAVYEALSSKDLLERCVQGLTQNANESFHSKMWQRAHKIKYAGRLRIKFVARTTVLDHNFGYQKASILKALNISTEDLDKSLEIQEKRRKQKGALPQRTKKKAKNIKKSKKDYASGQF